MSRFKTLVGTFSIFLALFCGSLAYQQDNINCATIPMPHYSSPNFSGIVANKAPEPHRDESVIKYMEPSLRIHKTGVYGSGTICYFDKAKNIAYVISCAHLFRSENDAKDGVIVEAFYKNGKKLSTPQSFKAEVIAVKIGGYADDISLLKFTPDWEPTYFPIAKSDYNYEPGKILFSTGCDNASEVACYYIKILQLEQTFLATIENSPRPGRSGGGLITEDGWFVGICVRTSDVGGYGTGYYVKLQTIHEFLKNKDFGWLLEVSKKQQNKLLLSIPIVDRNMPQGNYPQDYVPVP